MTRFLEIFSAIVLAVAGIFRIFANGTGKSPELETEVEPFKIIEKKNRKETK